MQQLLFLCEVNDREKLNEHGDTWGTWIKFAFSMHIALLFSPALQLPCALVYLEWTTNIKLF
jgi:hypothetical protein